MTQKNKKTPLIFISHGSPMVSVENDEYTAALETLGKKLEKPNAIVVVSAHWESNSPIRVTASANPGLIYDFGGFPDELYELTYPSPGEPALAREIGLMLNEAKLPAQMDENRGLDHGAWVPLRRLFPQADVPVVQVSLPAPRDAEEIFRVGQALAPLRSRGMLLVGSGGVVHNLQRLHFGDKTAGVDSWAEKFDSWVSERLNQSDVKSLLSYRETAPHSNLAAPSTEHFDPLFFSLGAAPQESVQSVYEGFHYGNLSMRSFTVGDLN